MAPVLVVGLAYLVRLLWLRPGELGLDGGWSLAMAWLPIGQMLDLTARDAQPPLYYLALRGWNEFAGSGFFSTRYLPIALSTASVALLYGLGRRLGGPVVGWVGAFLLAFSPFYLHLTPSRFPAPALVAQILSVYLLLRLLDPEARPARRGLPALAAWAGYVVTSLTALYLSYLSAAPLAGQGLYLLLRRRWSAFHQWSRAALIVAAGFLPWLLYLLPRHVGTAWGEIAGPGASYWPADPFSGHPALMLGLFFSIEPLVGLPPWSNTVAFAALLVGALVVRRVRAWPRLRFPGLLLSLLITSLVLASLASVYWTNGHLGPKYPAVALPYFLVLLAYLLFLLSGSRRRTLSLLLAVLLVLWLGARVVQTRGQPDWDDQELLAEMRQLAVEQIGPADLAVFTNPGHAGYYQAWFGSGRAWSLVLADAIFPLPREQIRQDAQMAVEQAALGSRALWAFLIGGPNDLNEPLRVFLREAAYPAGHQWFPYVLASAYSLPREPMAEGPAGVRFLQGVELAGSAFSAEAWPGGTVNVALRWRARAPLQDDYKVFVHLIDTEGTRWAQHDDVPAAGERPTSVWGVGDVVRDRHGLFLPDDLPAGEYRLLVGLYRPGQGRLPLASGGDSIEVGPLRIAGEDR